VTPLDVWKSRVNELERPEILTTGTKRWEGSPPEDHSHHAPHGIWIGTDIEPDDLTVQIVGDIQTLWQTTDKKFDAIFSPATLEHVEMPWVAAYSFSQLLKPGGLLYIQTHQTFPLHGYPNDFYRFSAQALESLCFHSGMMTLLSGYEFPCVINPPASVTRWNVAAPSYLNVSIAAEKPRHGAKN